jgi:DHA1 family inner membrane transport protein
MLVLAALAAIAVPVVALVIREVPIGRALTVTERLLVLGDPRIVVLLIATLLSTAALNLVYIFSSQVTGYAGTALAALLLVYGVAGIIGTTASGPLTDRFDSRVVGVIALALEALALIAIAIAGHTFAALVVTFAIWGVTAFAATIPLQHRLLHVDSYLGAVAISWYSTALYLGIAIAPLAGATALRAGRPSLLPIIAAAISALCLTLFLAGYRARNPSRV